MVSISRQAWRWLGQPPGRLIALVALLLTAIGTLIGVTAYVQRDDRKPVLAASDLFVIDGLNPQEPDVAALATDTVVVNTDAHTLLISDIRLQLGSAVYPVQFASVGNCRGGPFRLPNAELVPLSLFVDLPSEQELAHLLTGEVDWQLQLIAADGALVPVKPTLPGDGATDQARNELIELNSFECPCFPCAATD